MRRRSSPKARSAKRNGRIHTGKHHPPEIRDRLAERIKHVIVDEYQDVHPIQEAIVWSLHEFGALSVMPFTFSYILLWVWSSFL